MNNLHNPMEIYLAEIPYEDNNQVKYRPALVVSVLKNEVVVFKITSKYLNKSKKIKHYYYPIKDWQRAGLNKPSYVDIHRTFTLPQKIVFRKPPLGKLTTYDVVNLYKFIQDR